MATPNSAPPNAGGESKESPAAVPRVGLRVSPVVAPGGSPGVIPGAGSVSSPSSPKNPKLVGVSSGLSSTLNSKVTTGVGSKFKELKERGSEWKRERDGKALQEKERGKAREKAREKMREKIYNRIQRRENISENFITIKSLQEVWHWVDLNEFAEDQGMEVNRDQLDFIYKSLLRTLSILVYIRWKKWPKFKRIFMRDQTFREDRLDSKLPHKHAILQDKSFLKKSWGPNFFETQDIFVPIILTQGKIDTHPIQRRLPLNTGGETLGSGAFGEVTKEVIPAGYLIFNNGLQPPGDYTVARKVIQAKKDYIAEKKILENLQGALTEHKHIVTDIAAVAIGNEFNLFFDIAQTDLNKFLYGLTEPVDLKKLIEETWKLVDALRFLHDDLYIDRGAGRAKQKGCCHSDLKPDNILVYERPGDSIGMWKISDFGISTIGNLSSEGNTANNGNRTIMAKSREPGVYTAPETDVGRRSDIWSFGCIFHQVVAAGLGGRSLVERLDEERGEIGNFGEARTSENFYISDKNGDIVLKPCVTRWLGKGLAEYKNPLAGECGRLIMDMLQIDQDKRPPARDVKARLGDIIDGNLSQERTTSAREQTTSAREQTTPAPRSGEGGVEAPHGQGSIPPPVSSPAPLSATHPTSIPNFPPPPFPISPPISPPVSSPARAPAFPPTSISNFPPTPPPTSPALSPLLSVVPPSSSISPHLSRNLIIAIENRNPGAVKARLQRGDDIFARDDKGYCALHHAAKIGGERVLLALLESEQLRGDGIKGINQKDDSGATPLHLAASGGKTKIASRLIEAGADINMADEFGRSPLHVASLGSHSGHTDLVELLLDHGAKKDHLPPQFKDKYNFITFRKRKEAKRR